MRFNDVSANIARTPSYFASILIGALLVSFSSLMAVWPEDAQAHKGHGGSMVTIMKKKVALKAMLPAGAKIAKRKQKVSKEAAGWAEKQYGVDLDNSIVTYYLARDRESGEYIGAAIIQKSSYRHGDVLIAVGIDAEQRITKTAITALSDKYIPEFDGTVGTGFIDKYEGMTLKQLADEVVKLESESADKPSRLYASRLHEAAVLLAAFLHSAK